MSVLRDSGPKVDGFLLPNSQTPENILNKLYGNCL